ncbi:chromosomal replication initiator protein DnaA [Helicobacter kayseriensis]|uniref:chromosomal replication initiator protein DnaA n=1 Tax=Helicobacter kayseriensis TaxID=2905877 RepID=UPI001E431464|nr:chromosomal replication initiator protein DnaA [Helicobacter kayseriensis]MCE3047148.1 chromosomal replication initiator protein DnaA [Helicobacter kayseriensis]MCE3048519.1 chromosomal replication initiator protein DnaA [Helicobacter kayseriensis]
MIGNDILKKLKDKISLEEYEHYISKLKFDENASKSDLKVFSAPNIFLANWINNKYSQEIAFLFEEHLQTKPEIKIIVESKKEDVKTSTLQQIQKKTITKTFLNPSYTFSSFVVGDSNKLAFEVSKIIAQTQAKKYNPVLLYGGTGLGKTHLLNAIGNEVANKGKNVIYVTAEQFLNDYMVRINNNTMDRFREKYRNCDYLLIDDVQFFGGKEKIQEEFFHTFNELHNSFKQIVMTSDKAPKKILGLEERLKSRFEWGFCADIIPPEFETKIAIIQQKCQINGIHIDEETIHFLASHINDNIRQIEGILIKLNVQASIMGQDITLKMAKNAIKESLEENNENITLENIIKMVSKALNIKPSEIKSKSRTKKVAEARRFVIYLARSLTPNSMPVLAKELNMKDHSAISKAYKKMQEETEENLHTKAIIDEIKTKIQEEQTKKDL